ncbi:NADPH-dependent pterin aldehyde reductase-like [Rutidosis leptorrhynchoides]|uniref:NADPH-dependent pterin aldehyde reductase-like n=1 Tax=Rutidosis leptorrhynchoides TaxID=125765 RepID=UPI003A99C2F3
MVSQHPDFHTMTQSKNTKQAEIGNDDGCDERRGGGGGAKGVTVAQKTVLITGVSRGLGKALALEIAKRGHFIIGCSPSSSSSSSEHQHIFLNVDVCSNSSVQELARVVMEKKGVPDIIVNNAGTINKNNRLWEVPEEELNAVIDTNLKGLANVLRHFIPLMIEKKQGIIVNMSSGWGRSAAAQVAPYCASKWAVEGLTKSVAKELPAGMAIIALNPGVINTDMLQSCFGSSSSLYQAPDSWAPKAADMILNLTMADNGASISVLLFELCYLSRQVITLLEFKYELRSLAH